MGIVALAKPSFVLPAAITASIFFGAAGIRHATDKIRSRNQNTAMMSDLFVALVLAAYIVFVTVH